jgi:hypothetical protein
VVGCVVNSVYTNGVDAELLEFHDITRTSCRVCDGVDELGGSTWLVVDSADVESVRSLEESCRMLVIYKTPNAPRNAVPLPLVVIGVRVEDARATNSSTGDGAAKTDVAAAKAAMAVKVFMFGCDDLMK